MTMTSNYSASSGIDTWDKNPDGSIAVKPLVGWSTATFLSGMAGGIRIEFATNQQLTHKGAVQVVMTASQIRELSNVLLNMAERMDQQVAATRRPTKAN